MHSKRIVGYLLLLGVFARCLEAQGGPIREVKTIFVTPLRGGNQELTNMLQAKLIAAVSKVPGIAVVEEAEDADAILTGSGEFENGAGMLLLQGGMRLFSRDSGRVLWADTIRSSRYSRSVSSSFAENAAKSLARARAQ